VLIDERPAAGGAEPVPTRDDHVRLLALHANGARVLDGISRLLVSLS
jgi:hypothetical protein